MKEVGIRELGEKVKESRQAPLRVGATVDPHRRAGEYKKDYSETDTMFYAKTKNMNLAENQLLEKCNERKGCSLNDHKRSNAPASEGYVYAIFP